MSFRFRASETVPAGLRRIVREQIDRAIEDLESPDDRHEAVHQARKRFKKIRAVLRLFRPEIPELYQMENAFYRDLGRDLSAVRDATTLIEALDALAENSGQPEAPLAIKPAREIFEERRQALIDRMGQDPHVIRNLKERLGKARGRIAEWPLQAGGFETIATGLQKSYAAGRRALAGALAEPTVENLHELRKRAKDHWYHARLFECVWPERMEAYAKTLENLAEMLGDDHDLAIVRITLLTEPDVFGVEESLRPLIDLIDKRQEELRPKFFILSRRVYAEKPRALRRRFEMYWEVMEEER